jgi:hypothetical protein
MLTDTQTLNMRNVLHQIYVNLYVEFGQLFAIYFVRNQTDDMPSCEEPTVTCGTPRRRWRRERAFRAGVGSICKRGFMMCEWS